jgi:acyl dehydratase
MAIDPGAIGAESGPVTRAWTASDCLLYALAAGAGVDDLSLTTDNTAGVAQQVLPSYGVVLGTDPAIFKRLGRFDWAKVVHAEQGFELLKPIPPAGSVNTTTRVANLYDKGRAAIAVTESESVDGHSGEPLFRTRLALFIGGAGGWGGDRGPSVSWQPPDRGPDRTVSYQTTPQQALLYRLCGDRNPLHSDPGYARRAGFERPILHGLCTYGFTGRALLHAVAGGDPARLISMNARFAAPVLPGDSLHVDIWRVAADRAEFRTRRGDGTVVLANGACQVRS